MDIHYVIVFIYRIEILWRPVTGHLLEVSHHSNAALREWGAGTYERFYIN